MKTSLDIFSQMPGNPWKEFASLQRRMDRLFDEFSTTESVLPSQAEVNYLPACDLEETDGQYLISVDVPGIPKDQIKIDLTGNTLTISGEHQEEHKAKEGKRRIFERYQGRFERSFTLPGMANTDKVEANYKDGVLKITVPKSEASKTRRVPIGESKMEEKKLSKAGETRAA